MSVPIVRYKVEVVGAQPTAHGGSKEDFQAEGNFLMVHNAHSHESVENPSAIQWNEPITISFDPKLEELHLSVIKGKSGFFAVDMVIGEVFIPFQSIPFGSVEYYHIKTRRKGEVKGLLKMRVIDTDPHINEPIRMEAQKIRDRERKRKPTKKSMKKKDTPMMDDRATSPTLYSPTRGRRNSKEEEGGEAEGSKKKYMTMKLGLSSSRKDRGDNDFISMLSPKSKTRKDKDRDDLRAMSLSPASPTLSPRISEATVPADSTPKEDKEKDKSASGGGTQEIRPKVRRQIELQSTCGGTGNLSLGELNMKLFPEEKWFPASLKSSVTELDAAFNVLVEFPVTSFFSNLRTLDLAGNQLTSIADCVGENAKLQELILTGNKIVEISPEINKLTDLRKLMLGNNQITRVPDLSSCVRMEELILCGNELEEIPRFLGSMEKLLILDMSNCNMTYLPNNICKCTKLLELDLSSNKLEVLPHNFGKLSRLGRLSVASNKLTDIPISFGKVQGLTQCDISSNPFKNKAIMEKLAMGVEHLMRWLELRMDALSDFGDSVFIDALDEDSDPPFTGSTQKPKPESQTSKSSAAPVSLKQRLGSSAGSGSQTQVTRSAPRAAKVERPRGNDEMQPQRALSPPMKSLERGTYASTSKLPSPRIKDRSPPPSRTPPSSSSPLAKQVSKNPSKSMTTLPEMGSLPVLRQLEDLMLGEDPLAESVGVATEAKEEEKIAVKTEKRDEKKNTPPRHTTTKKTPPRNTLASKDIPQKPLPPPPQNGETASAVPNYVLEEEDAPENSEELAHLTPRDARGVDLDSVDADMSNDESDAGSSGEDGKKKGEEETKSEEFAESAEGLSSNDSQEGDEGSTGTTVMASSSKPMDDDVVRSKLFAVKMVAHSISLELLGQLTRYKSVLVVSDDMDKIVPIGKIVGSLREETKELKNLLGAAASSPLTAQELPGMGRPEKLMRLVEALVSAISEITRCLNLANVVLEDVEEDNRKSVQVVKIVRAMRGKMPE